MCRVYFVWMCISWFWIKLLFSSGEVFSEQASRYQTSVVSLEAQNILEAPFKGLSSMCCVYFVWMCISWFWPKIVVFVGRGFFWRVFSEQASRCPTSVVSLEARNILEVPCKGPSSMCCVYFVWMCILWFRPIWSQKASQNMQKASHIIKVPQCHFPNHILRWFTHFPLGSSHA